MDITKKPATVVYKEIDQMVSAWKAEAKVKINTSLLANGFTTVAETIVTKTQTIIKNIVVSKRTHEQFLKEDHVVLSALLEACEDINGTLMAPYVAGDYTTAETLSANFVAFVNDLSLLNS